MKKKLILFLIFISIIGVTTVNANDTAEKQLGFELKLYYDHNSPVTDLENVDVEEALLLKIVVINPYDKWIKLSNARWHIYCKFDGESKDCHNRQDNANFNPLIPPGGDEFFIVLDQYNRLSPNERLKLNTIEYQVPTPFSCYDEERNFDYESLCSGIDIAPINPLHIRVKAKVPTSESGGFNLDEFYVNYIVKYKELWPFSSAITAIGVLILSVLGYLYKTRGN